MSSERRKAIEAGRREVIVIQTLRRRRMPPYHAASVNARRLPLLQ